MEIWRKSFEVGMGQTLRNGTFCGRTKGINPTFHGKNEDYFLEI